MPDMGKTAIAQQFRVRRTATLWLLDQVSEYPLGIVPVPTAARALAVTTTRIMALAEEGRMRILQMPGGHSRDRFIPVRDLIAAPSIVGAGRIGLYGPANRVARKSGEFFDSGKKRRSRN